MILEAESHVFWKYIYQKSRICLWKIHVHVFSLKSLKFHIYFLYKKQRKILKNQRNITQKLHNFLIFIYTPHSYNIFGKIHFWSLKMYLWKICVLKVFIKFLLNRRGKKSLKIHFWWSKCPRHVLIYWTTSNLMVDKKMRKKIFYKTTLEKILKKYLFVLSLQTHIWLGWLFSINSTQKFIRKFTNSYKRS